MTAKELHELMGATRCDIHPPASGSDAVEMTTTETQRGRRDASLVAAGHPLRQPVDEAAPRRPVDDSIACLLEPSVWDSEALLVEHIETHISHVFLVDDRAFKIKKPVRHDFLDYSTLALRKHFCEEEVRINQAVAGGLYLGVVAIHQHADGSYGLDGEGPIVDYAVEMRRFDQSDLLSSRVRSHRLVSVDIRELASTLVGMHERARRCDPRESLAAVDFLRNNVGQVAKQFDLDEDRSASSRMIRCVVRWLKERIESNEYRFLARALRGRVRVCHGDLHTKNVVRWNRRFVAFDAIEFSDSLRQMDVFGDAAFLAMDLASTGHIDWSRLFRNEYFEQSGDYESLEVFRWFTVYRALVRAMAERMRGPRCRQSELDRYLQLAYRFTLPVVPSLTITHGVSGSGKTTISEQVVRRHGAIRIRSDIERRRIFDMPTCGPLQAEQSRVIHHDDADRAVYKRLASMAGEVLSASYPVVIDATCLKRWQRELFRDLADRTGIHFSILDCHHDIATLSERVTQRLAGGRDASDADLSVLQQQLANREPLTDCERRKVVDIPDPAEVIDSIL